MVIHKGVERIQVKETRSSVDFTNKDMGNHYLRDVHDAFSFHCVWQERIFVSRYQ